MKHQRKQFIVDAITFDELVAHGLATTSNVVNGMPWSFEFEGCPVTHESDECYIVGPRPGAVDYCPDTIFIGPSDILVLHPDGYLCKMSKDTFAADFEPVQSIQNSEPPILPATSGLSFSEALNRLKDGHRVAREGWNGKGMWLTIIHPGNAMYTKGGVSCPMLPCIGMRTAQGDMCPGWLASQTDMLAEDWTLLP